MTDEERKMLAYLARMLWKVAVGLSPEFDECRALDNIADILGSNEIDEKEFIW